MKLGILSDSHGNVEATRRAVAALLEGGAVRLVHLGDLCESMEGRLDDGMLALVRAHGITVLKGNNDLAVERLLAELTVRNAREDDALAFLRGLPLLLALDDLLFSHSMPDGTVRSIYDPIDDGGTARASEVFIRTDFRAHFCGHSHSPVLFRRRGNRVTREAVPADADVLLTPGDRFIIVAGSAAEGECALLDTERMTYRRLAV